MMLAWRDDVESGYFLFELFLFRFLLRFAPFFRAVYSFLSGWNGMKFCVAVYSLLLMGAVSIRA